ELGAFSNRAAENEQASCRGGCAQSGWIRCNGLLERGEIQRAERGPDGEYSEEETEVAQAIGDECLLAGIGGASFLKPTSNEQVAGDGDQFPEDEQLEEIICEHDTEHGKGKKAQAGEKAREARVFFHVAP